MLVSCPHDSIPIHAHCHAHHLQFIIHHTSHLTHFSSHNNIHAMLTTSATHHAHTSVFHTHIFKLTLISHPMLSSYPHLPTPLAETSPTSPISYQHLNDHILNPSCSSLEIIGKGGCGEVYKAELSRGKLIAVKKTVQPPKDAAELVEKGISIIEEDAEFVLSVVMRFFFAAFVTMKL